MLCHLLVHKPLTAQGPLAPPRPKTQDPVNSREVKYWDGKGHHQKSEPSPTARGVSGGSKCGTKCGPNGPKVSSCQEEDEQTSNKDMQETAIVSEALNLAQNWCSDSTVTKKCVDT